MRGTMPRPARPFAILLFATACSSPQATETEDPHLPTVAETRVELRQFGEMYHYDVGYLEQLLDLSPSAFSAFAGGMAMAEHHSHLPADAHAIAVLGALMADDCGQCTQLYLRIAVEMGVERSTLHQLLEDPNGLPARLRIVHTYAQEIVAGRNVTPELLAKIRLEYGGEGLAELAVNVLGSRIYPGLRRALGAEEVCPPAHLDF